MARVELELGGRAFEGWEEVEVSRSLETCAGAFRLRVSQPARWPIAPGSRCALRLEGEPVATGHVDRVSASLAAAARTITVEGRDLTADLVDCSALNAPGEWTSAELVRIATAIAAPYSVSVALEADAGEPFSRFAVQPGETAFEAIERAARMRGLLATSDAEGRLLLTRPGTAAAEVAIVEGENLLAGQASLDLSGRHRRYVVRGQAPGLDLLGTGAVTAPQGEATDELARAGRALLILAETSTTPATAATRAAWEAAVRAARGSSVSLTVQGWRQRRGGALWRPGLLVDVVAPSLGIEGRLLVAQVTFTLSGGTGTTTALELARPDAYQPAPLLSSAGDPIAAFQARYGIVPEGAGS